MSLERVIRDVIVHTWRKPDGLVVRVTKHICESNIGGGKMVVETDTYDCLSAEEAINILEAVAHEPMPGTNVGEQMGLFAL